MKKLYFILYIIIITIIGCNYKDKKSETLIIDKVLSNQNLTKVYSLKNKNYEIGDLYVNYLKDEVFDKLLVINGKDTLYKIEKNVIEDVNDTIKISKEDFYGYKFSLLKEDYFVFHVLTEGGKGVSDNITINWNNKCKRLELLILP